MKKKMVSKICFHVLASVFLLFSTLKYATANYLITDGCGTNICTGTGYTNIGYCSRLMCYTSVPCQNVDETGNWTVYANSSQVYTKHVTPTSSASVRGIAPNAVIQCVGNYQSGYQATEKCCN